MNIKSLRNSLFAAAAVAALGVTYFTMSQATAATKGDPASGMKYGAVAVATASATAIPGMGGANAVLVQNLGPNAIYCGDASVTTSTGVQVPANGGVLTIDIVQATAASTTSITPVLFCIAATALQSSPADTRYMRVK